MYHRTLFSIKGSVCVLIVLTNIAAYAQTSTQVDTPAALNARASALLSALENGETANRGNLDALIDQVRQNEQIPAHERFVLVSRARGIAIKDTKGLTRADRLAAYEQSARDMIAEFPDEVEPYAALLALADAQTDAANAVRIAQDLLDNAAPASVKAGAQTILDREAMVGKPLDFAYDDGIGLPINLTEFRGKVVVVYAWTGVGKQSYQWLRVLMSKASPDVEFLGLNFDPNRNDAISKTTEIALGSRQIYEPGGLQGPVARTLHISRIPVIYLIDRAGIVRNVRTWENFPQELAALVAEGGRP